MADMSLTKNLMPEQDPIERSLSAIPRNLPEQRQRGVSIAEILIAARAVPYR